MLLVYDICQIMQRMANRIFKKIALLAAPLALLASSSAFAADRSVSVDGANVVIPVPNGFTDITATPKGVTLSSLPTDTVTRVVAVLVAANRATGTIYVRVPRQPGASKLLSDNFSKFTDHQRHLVGNMTALTESANKDFEKKQQQLKAASGGSLDGLKIGTPLLVAVERDDEAAFGYTSIIPMSVDINGKTEPNSLLMCMYVVRVNGAVVSLQVDAPRKQDGDLDWVREQCRSYVEAFITANRGG
ncbi:hypothetical protein [Ralstonia mojiangensis]|uniref:hypothetical protein n=1 Tax=Ralstonia mojiangensis TaxID=2953895 RepID=UPI00209093A1|nr:hypothetical protein [Ralstonia mojiangensis]MCO5410805.1 hypothetical protein [Ralstonia mojiangensis]